MKPNVRAVFERRGEGEEEGSKKLGRKGEGWWEGHGALALTAAVGWERVVTQHRALRSGLVSGYVGPSVGEEW